MEKINVLMLPTGSEPYVKEIEPKLENYQKLVGGYIECVSLEKDVDLIVNMEGKYNGSEPNRLLVFEKESYGLDEDYLDIVYGDCFVVGVEDGDFASLSDLHILKYRKIFYHDYRTELMLREAKKRILERR